MKQMSSIKHHRQQHFRRQYPRQQKGIALVMALILLLIITVLGVSAARMTGMNTQTAGNSMYSALVFQGAESALGRSGSDLFNIREAALTRGNVTVPASYFNPVETVTSGVTLDSSATVSYQGVTDTLPPNGLGNDARFNYQVFQINGASSLNATSARDNHTEGLAIPIAP
ncbi:PilX N-terminal domain-containing pilus assembly protein [Cocleimonas sp. KMM 6892]|uniref:pilus assembly PilX family protein n=1 Tax=unclassified Cocleimonas TaxID=2639732 RepID=UPI002DBD7671|nr:MULTISPECIES: PilX N-terminal domain-containing pilus assembly protein [unclassified Cocleimonas]MEB8433834.1 PilX N-terminal domain-containing pilus assembly protein [Cocleimonas sp. KMM 6892]MEC4716645.1 PilX N-terminal domain-containing pilus assembly protein [Cocleimonas sp. KMM 6895]MEC4746200.1 PilX N-terminal domain-containing pilus assembly protein [Cocleimonas sp. KMM 6896]